MKSTKILAAIGIITLTGAALNTTLVQAKSVTDTESTNAHGKVQFVLGDDESGTIIDPSDSTGSSTVEPSTSKPNVGDDDGAEMVWYPDFDFGTHQYKKAEENKYDAVLTMAKNGFNGVIKPSFIQVENTPQTTNWKVEATLGNFIKNGTTGGAGNILTGADVTIDTITNVKNIPTGGAATPATGAVTLAAGGAAVEIGNFSAALGDYTTNSANSLIFGSVSKPVETEDPNDKKPATDNAPTMKKVGTKYVNDLDAIYNKGVTLTVPANLPVSATGYTADLEWSITSTFDDGQPVEPGQGE